MGNKIDMTAGQRKEVKELVKGSFANYDRSMGDCLLMDAACYQACNFTGLCRYFKEACSLEEQASLCPACQTGFHKILFRVWQVFCSGFQPFKILHCMRSRGTPKAESRK